MQTRNIEISVEQLSMIQKLIEVSDGANMLDAENEELDLIRGMIDDAIIGGDVDTYGFAY